ncbi:amino acid adenylation domain-containing protein [Amycolatopsis sp. cmx-4-61]|uniref:amino acid adenylation domain-containing protein n=1 Tax=Amycolatopsis sp. cmx-4-61 TaxID=2790937 RepID=UPI0039787004
MSVHPGPVAIVGIACRFPGADTPARFRDHLGAGRDAIRAPGEERVRWTGAATGVDYLPMGYLDRIDLFDHEFFGLSRREAEIMDPHQRMLLQLAYEAFEDAGLAPGTLRGSETGVFLGTHNTAYQTLYRGFDPQQILGSLPAAAAARLAYVFDLHGPALVVDTACSSGLAAVATAVQHLRGGAVDAAVAGGVSVQPVLSPRSGHVPLRGVESPDGTCRPFDARANGTAGGEGGGIVVLKRLADAVADRDTVYAVITGVAVNHNGHRALSMAAPSPQAQAAAITTACRDAGTEPAALGYVECHGSATPLGDAVEIEGLRLALSGSAPGRPPCAIGSVKGNVGHLDAAAGLAGLLRAVLSVREAMHYPTAGFTTPNPQLDFGGLVTVPARATEWSTSDGLPRRAGISSFGLTGTNVHVVVEQAPPVPSSEGDDPGAAGPHLVTLSAKTAAALRRCCRRWAGFLRETTHPLPVVAQVLNRGRDDHGHRLAFVVDSTVELADALADALGTASVPDRPSPPARPVVLLFSGEETADSSTVDAEVSALHARYRQLASLGLPAGRFVGCGTGNRVIGVVRGTLTLAEARQAGGAAEPGHGIDPGRLRAAVAGFERDGAVLVELGADARLSEAIRPLTDLPVVSCGDGAGRRFLLERLGRLYTLGAGIDWARHYAGTALPRIPAPTYPFEPVSCWYRPAADTRGTEPATEPTPEFAPELTPEPARPRTAPGAGHADVERRLAAVWSRTLKVPDVDRDADYFALGGTSIAGITVLRGIEREFGVELGFTDLYEHPTLARLAGRIREHLPAAERSPLLTPITPVPRGGDLPLSFGQEQLWYLDRLVPQSPLYNIPVDLRFTGPLDVAALTGAVRDLAGRHEVLRSRLPSRDGEPFALDSAPPPGLPVTDLSSLPEAERTRRVAELVTEAATRPFDLASGPLWRSRLLTLAPDDHVLLLTWHHIVFDGWSPSIFFPELAELYQARRSGRPDTLAPLPIQYADYAAWQRARWSSASGPGLDYWRQRLAGLRRAELPLDRPRPPVREFDGDFVEFTVDAALAEQVREFGRRHGVTSFITMLAALTALLHRWAGWEDVAIGVATSGRNHPDTQGLIGYFNNALPFRTEVTGELSFTDLVARCARTAAGVLDHDIPFEKIVSALGGRRDPARHPVFDVAYTHQNAPSQVAELPGLDSDRQSGGILSGVAPGTAKFDLTLGVVEQGHGAMHGYVEYAVALFDRSTATGLAGRFTALLAEVLADPGRRLGRSHPVRARAAAEPVPFWRRVARHATGRPHHPAVVDEHGSLTYRELNRRANRLARRLVAAGVTGEVPVPVLAHRDADLVTGWLAVAKAGGAFVPVDPASPRPRVDAILADIGASAVVLGRSVDSAPAGAEPFVVDAVTTEADDEDLNPAFVPRALAYVCYTSGSSGRPHGCATEHGQLEGVIRWYRDELGLTGADRVLQGAWPSFDTTIMEVFAALDPGATLQLADSAIRDPGHLLDWMAGHGTTAAFLPTPLADVLLTEVDPPAGLRLRVLTTGGDQLRVRPGPRLPFRLLNMYGPTECTIVATAGDVAPAAGGALPDIGVPISDTVVHLLDADGRPVPDGELGEIHIGGAVVGRGYHALPGLTASRFVADPFAGPPGARMYRTGDLGRRLPGGALEFHGRADDQVEIRGYRVEPAEVEQVLRRHPAVAEALVVGAPTATGGHRLVAHVVPRGPAPEPAEVAAWAAAALPAYLVPDHVLVTGSLPTTVNGKLDRKRARQAVGTLPARPAGPAGRLGVAEQVVAGLCAELLGLDDVSPQDNFFELGGDSLLGIRFGTRAAKAGIRFSPQDLLRHRTLRDLVAQSAPPDPATGTPPATSVPLSPIMHQFLDVVPGFVQAHVLEATGDLDHGTLRTAFQELAALHEPLRFRLRHNAFGPYFACVAAEENELLDVRPLAEEDEHAAIERGCAELSAAIDLAAGPVLRARLYDRGPGRVPLVLLVLHHFVSDSMSAVVLFDDLDAAVRRSPGAPPPAGRPPAWRQWAGHLRAMAGSDTAAAELPHWTATLRAGASAPVREPARAGDGGSVHRQVAMPPGFAGEEAAICALACGVARWQHTSQVAAMVEGAATPNPYRPAERGATVGWYTSLHPVVLPVDPAGGPAASLPAVAAALRAVPHDGVGYGVLRHLSPASTATTELRSLPEPAIMLGHQGNDGSGLDSGLTAFTVRGDLYPEPPRSVTDRFSLVLISAVREGCLAVSVFYDARFTREEIEVLADDVAAAFAGLGQSCRP